MEVSTIFPAHKKNWLRSLVPWVAGFLLGAALCGVVLTC